MFSRKQKIIFGLFVAISFGLIFTFQKPTAYAYTEAELRAATYRIVSTSTLSVTIAGQTYTFTDINTGDTTFNWKPPNSSTIGAPCVSNANVANHGVNYTTDLNPPPNKGGNVTSLGQMVMGGRGPFCSDFASVTGITLLNPNNVTFGGAGTPPGPTPGPTPPAATTPTDECKRGSITSFEWWACPLLEGLDSIAQNLTDIIEGLLFFETANTGDDSYEGVYRAWNLFRYIASIILVIVMFVMVISQAISMGPFDAYTVRKLLPKLIAAAIAIQLSWPLCIFVIDLFNDLGRGIADLMMFPFGGADELTLDDSLGEVMGGTSTVQGVGILAILIIGGVLAALNIFLLLAVFVGIVFSLFIGFLVLVVRKMLLIILIMLAPVALALWILPGTKKYWDLWQNTFIGLLMMFPIIMALIASGRIMANIVAGGGGFGGASLPIQALNAILVLVVFFAPFWLIPKTFSWGGRAFANVAGTVNNRSKGLVDRPQKFLGERQTQRRQFRRAESAARLNDNNYAGGVGGRSRRFIDRAMTGHLDPTRRYAGANEMRKHELETAKLGFEQSQAANTRDLELAKLEAARRLAPQAHEAQMAAIPASERKRLQEFANTEVSDMQAVPDLIQLAQTGTREQRIAATGKLLDMRRFDDVQQNGLTTNVGPNGEDIYQETFATRPELFGNLAQQRADMLPPNLGRSAAHTFGGNDPHPQTGQPQPGVAGISVGQLVTQHQSFFNTAATEFEQPNPTPANHAALEGAAARIEELARSTQGRTLVGSEAEVHINRILEERYRRQNNMPAGTPVPPNTAPTYQSYLP